MLVVRDHQDGIAQRHAEQRHESKHSAEGQLGARGEHAADQGKRQVGKDEEKVAPIAGYD